MDAHVPLSLHLLTRLVEGFLLASQVHGFLWLRPRVGRVAACAALAIGLFLILFGDMFVFDQNVLGLDRREAFWRPMSSVWTAGCFGAYALYWAWRLWNRLRTPAAGVDTVDPARRYLLRQWHHRPA